MEYLSAVLTTLLSVAVLFLIAKALGYRQMSELSLFDYINGITIGSIASEVAVSQGKDVVRALIAMVVFGLVTLLLSFLTDVSLPLRRFVTGKPIVLYENKTLYYKNLRKARLDVDEFLVQCRSKGYFDLSQIEAAVLEPNGKISFLPKSEHRPATPADLKISVTDGGITANVILDGKIMAKNLSAVGYDVPWLERELQRLGSVPIDSIMLATCTADGTLSLFLKSMEETRDVFI